MNPDATRRAAGYVIFRRRGGRAEYLLLRSARHGTWAPPKGHLDGGETDEEGAIRELTEETGMRGPEPRTDFREETRYTVTDDDGSVHEKVVVWFVAELDDEVSISPEHDESGWFPIDEALDTLRHDNLRALLRAADSAVTGG